MPVSQCTEFAREIHSGPKGTRALALTPTPWHKPSLRLYCAGYPRRDFSAFDSLTFAIRAVDASQQTDADLTVQLTTWHAASADVRIRDFVAGGIIDETWRTATIPLAAFAGPEWDLRDVEFLRWNLDPHRGVTLVDDIKLQRTRPGGGVVDVAIESDQYLRLRLAHRFDKEAARAATYRLSDGTDSRRPRRIGIQWQTSGFDGTPVGNSAHPRIDASIVLEFDKPLQSGQRYILTITGLKRETGEPMAPSEHTVAFEPRAKNANIKINQVGYLPHAPKIGRVGSYLGDLGAAVWALSANDGIMRWRVGYGWEALPSPRLVGRGVLDIAALGTDDAWVVGPNGFVARWDGERWRPVPVPTTARLNAIAFAPDGTGWIVGNEGIALRRMPHQAQWRAVATGIRDDLLDVYVSHHEGVLAVGTRGVRVHGRGDRWVVARDPKTPTFYSVGGFPGAGVWAVGTHGAIASWRHGRWGPTTSPTAANWRFVVGDANGGGVISGVDGQVIMRPGFGQGFAEIETPPTGGALPIRSPVDGSLWLLGAGTMWSRDRTDHWRRERLPQPDRIIAASVVRPGSLRLRREIRDVDILDAATNSVVLTTPLTLIYRDWHLAGETVYGFDFSSLQSPGTYRARIGGIGVSDDFEIRADVWDRAAITTARALYHQRCGLTLNHTNFSHDACHLHPATVLQPPTSQPAKTHRQVHGGWHDAGDYNKYVPTGVSALWFLLTAYEATQSGSMHADSFGIPESGNGIPDVLDEARWELDWLIRLQDTDGGIAHKVTTRCWVHGMPDKSDETQFITAKTTHDTAAGAAILAAGARIFARIDAALGKTYLDAARRAWSYLRARPDALPASGFVNPPDICTGEYRDPDGDADERAWAAAELFRTTGEKPFHDAFAEYWPRHPPLWGWNPWRHRQRNAAWTYLQTPRAEVNSAWRAQILEALRVEGEMLVERTTKSPYATASRVDIPAHIGWGSFAQSTAYSFTLLQAFVATGDKRYLSAATLNANAQLGLNPLSMSFITGVGARHPRDPLHHPSMYDGIAEPVPGLPVFGPMTVLNNANPFNRTVQSDENTYPSWDTERGPFPPLRRYIDSNELVGYNEFTVLEIARTAAALLWLGSISDDQSP